MSLFNSLVNHTPTFRFGGFQPMGAFTKNVDKRTTEQLLENIEYFAEYSPEVAQLKNELKSMNPKHLGLVSDICELSNTQEMINTDINMKKLVVNGKSLFAALIEKLPKASKDNPEALNFAQEVINQTDSIASKYFLASSINVFDHPEVSRHLSATRPFVKDIARQTLRGMYLMDYSKEKKFVDCIAGLINPTVKPEKIELIQKLAKVAHEIPGENVLYIDRFVRSNTPIKQVEENLEVVPQVAEMFAKEGKKLDIVDFVNNNTNLY